MNDQPHDLLMADWVWTRYGILFHIARPKERHGDGQWHTWCGRFAAQNADAPWCWFNGRACEICVRAAREHP
jgi:hypothetical protein